MYVRVFSQVKVKVKFSGVCVFIIFYFTVNRKNIVSLRPFRPIMIVTCYVLPVQGKDYSNPTVVRNFRAFLGVSMHYIRMNAAFVH